MSKKQRKFRKIKMLKNCSLLKKLKNQFGTSAENYEVLDELRSHDGGDGHWDAYDHVHLPYGVDDGAVGGVGVYQSFHGHLPTFYKRRGR